MSKSFLSLGQQRFFSLVLVTAISTASAQADIFQWPQAGQYRSDTLASIATSTSLTPTADITSLPTTTDDNAPVDIAAQPGWRVVYFWTTACPCVTACENYSLRPLAQQYAGKVKFYAICSDSYDLKKPQSELTATIKGHHLPYPVLFDRTHATAKALGAMVTPEVFLISPDNQIAFSGMPDDSRRYLLQTGKHGYTKTYLSTALAQALADKPVAPSHTELQGCIVAW